MVPPSCGTPALDDRIVGIANTMSKGDVFSPRFANDPMELQKSYGSQEDQGYGVNSQPADLISVLSGHSHPKIGFRCNQD